MGGCKCVFQHCKMTTGVAKKIHPQRETHFFHFPIKDRERCVNWCIYSNNMEFLSLPDEKLKNKVICDFHFKSDSFMNYKREKLNKTNAIPTIYISDETEVDLLEAPTEWVEINKNQANSQEAYIPKNINIDEEEEVEEKLVEFDLHVKEEEDSPARKKKRIIVQNQPIKILNIEAIPKMKIIEAKPKMNNLPIVPSQSSSREVKIGSFAPPSNQENQGYSIRRISPQKVKRIKQISENIEEEDVSMLIIDGESTNEVESNSKDTEEIKTILLQFMKDNAEIKNLLTVQRKCDGQESSNQNINNVSQTNEISNISQSHLNKVQLFNGIKRYLSPAMVALLRMDLFTSSSSRDYKADEKVICTEILQFGDEVYNFLLDEWRLRLPPKLEVQKWLDEKQLQDETFADDAC